MMKCQNHTGELFENIFEAGDDIFPDEKLSVHKCGFQWCAPMYAVALTGGLAKKKTVKHT